MSPRMGGYVPADHSTRHEDGGRDEISIASLSGEPATLTTHEAAATAIHGVGAGTIVGTGLTQTLTAKTLTSPTIQGTVLAGTGLTMPAFTAGGDIAAGSQKIVFTDVSLARSAANVLGVFAEDGTTLKDIYVRTGRFTTGLAAFGSPATFSARGVNDAYISFISHITDGADIEVGRFSGAAQPWFGIGKDSDVVKATYDDKLGFYSTPPIAKQAGVAVTIGAVHAALVALGLIAA